MGVVAAQSSSARVYPFSVAKDSARRFLAYLQLEDGDDIQQGDFAATDINVSVRDGDGTEVYTAALTPSAVVFNALQTDAQWRQDATGYNFAHTVPKGAFATVGFRRVEYILVPSSGSDTGELALVFEGAVRSLRGT